MKAIRAGLVLVAVVAAGNSCVVDRRAESAKNERPMTLTRQQASDMLSEAQCDYEAKCNRVGPSATYASHDHCVSVHREDSAKKFSKCNYGIKQGEMRACADQIRGQDCGGVGTVLDAFERSQACSSGKVCLD